jgi:helix-turn-helix protein
MSHFRQPVRHAKIPDPASSVFQSQWFVDMIPSPINGEVRLRMRRPSPWIRIAEAAELLACGIQTVHNLCDEGRLEWRWLDYEGKGGKKLVLVDSIQQYLAKKSQLPSARPAHR